MGRAFAAVLFAAILAAGGHAAAQSPTTIPEMWNAWCARCHAADGSGRVADRPVPIDPLDFSDCRVASPEPDADWELAIRDGGPAVGLSATMPAFGGALTDEQIRGFVAYIRTFCRERGWPHGNLNFPRAIFTEKAFPENEFLLLPMAAHSSTAADAWGARAVYERRIGRRTQIEGGLALRSTRVAGTTSTGLGDVELAAKHVFAASPARGAILSGGVELVLPTGRESRGLGKGTTVFEPYLAAGLGRNGTYLQSQVKLELPTRGSGRTLVYNTYAGRDLGGTPDTWTLGLELNGENRDLALTPQARKGLTRTGALAAALGVRLPLNRRSEREMQWVGYLLWEYLEPVRAAR
jgi:mono/diheme cytochrome c family protein